MPHEWFPGYLSLLALATDAWLVRARILKLCKSLLLTLFELEKKIKTSVPVQLITCKLYHGALESVAAYRNQGWRGKAIVYLSIWHSFMYFEVLPFRRRGVKVQRNERAWFRTGTSVYCPIHGYKEILGTARNRPIPPQFKPNSLWTRTSSSLRGGLWAIFDPWPGGWTRIDWHGVWE